MFFLRAKLYLNSSYKHLLPSVGLLLLVCTTSLAADVPKCYSTAGNLIKDKDVVPCNPNATADGAPGSHSSCCNQRTGDVCLTTGLCLNTGGKSPSGLLWLNGCTDPTWRDPACPQYCNPPPGSSTRDVSNPTLRACTPRSFCCAGYYDSDEECCKNAFNLTSRGAGKIERMLFPPEDATSSSAVPVPSNMPDNSNSNKDPNTCNLESSTNGNINGNSQGGSGNSTAAAITGGILGTLLLAAFIALAFVFFQNRKLKRSLLAAEAEKEATANSNSGGGGDLNRDDTYKEQYYQQQQGQYPGQGRVPEQQPICALPAEVADPNYGLSPPAWVPSELPVSEGRGQLP